MSTKGPVQNNSSSIQNKSIIASIPDQSIDERERKKGKLRPTPPISNIMPTLRRILHTIPIPIPQRHNMSPSTAVLNPTPCPTVRNHILPRAEIVPHRRGPARKPNLHRGRFLPPSFLPVDLACLRAWAAAGGTRGLLVLVPIVTVILMLVLMCISVLVLMLVVLLLHRPARPIHLFHLPTAHHPDIHVRSFVRENIMETPVAWPVGRGLIPRTGVFGPDPSQTGGHLSLSLSLFCGTFPMGLKLTASKNIEQIGRRIFSL